MNGKSIILLALAVVSGLGAMIGTSRILKNHKKPDVKMRDVLVATRDLRSEEVLTPDLVRVQQVPESNLPPDTFGSYKDVEDRWVQVKMFAGDPIDGRKLAPKGSPVGLVARIPKGMRAFALEVNETTGVSGFVLPDHRVDVIQVETKGNNAPPVAETILQDVLVLASGQVFTRPEDRSILSRSVTLAVTPDQADLLVAARTKGPLSLALRGLNDHAARPPKPAPEPPPPPAAPPVVAAKPVEPPPPPPAAPPAPATKAVEEAPARYVSVYRGIDNRSRFRIDGGPQDDEAFPAVDK
jgi:pilus assembly protein CpaB